MEERRERKNIPSNEGETRKGISFYHRKDNEWKNLDVQPLIDNEVLFLSISNSDKNRLTISLNPQEVSFLKDFLDSYLNEIIKNKIYGKEGGGNHEDRRK